MRYRIDILFFLIALTLLSGRFMSFAQNVDENARSTADHWVGFDARPSYIMPTHGFYSGWNDLGKALKVGGSVVAIEKVDTER